MKDYVSALIEAINNYNEDDINSKNRLRDLVCVISDNSILKEDVLIKELLYIASQKMRVFGYNVQNGFYREGIQIDVTSSDLAYLSNQAILEHYKSKVRTNNILDKSQRDIVDLYQSMECKRMLVSAPTSYGKTFIMREILFLNKERYNNVLLVFPTVALLRENAEAMEEINKEKEMEYRVIKSIDGEIDFSTKNIFVFTPERAMQLLANYPDINIDFFFYDEMYKIDEEYCREEITEDDEEQDEKHVEKKKKVSNFLDEARAKTFRICLYLLSKKVPEFYLAGPNIKEEKFGKGMKRYISLNNIAVIEVNFEPTKRIQVDAYDKVIVERSEDTSYIEKSAPVELSSLKNDKICDVVKYIENRGYGATLLYCTTPRLANDYAIKLSNNHQGKMVQDDEFKIFLEHLERNYNIDGSISEWSFMNVLKQGFGMHHGKMPKYIQKEVLESFNRGVFDLLFCTSTIVEGVNTDAKNMVVLNATKGGKPLTLFDFKNIIGRAGRYYHNFIGRYFLMDSKLAEFENSEDIILDFATYGESLLDVVDVDNAEEKDLEELNKGLKKQREEKQLEFMVPRKVFEKNRLVKWEYQDKLLRTLLIKQNFDPFYKYLQYENLVKSFKEYHAIGTVLDVFEKAGLLEDNITSLYRGISYTYCKEGFRGILKYEIDKARKDENRTLDKAYMSAFKVQKDIIEHKIPKLLALFECIFICACKEKNKECKGFSLSAVIRFYETGVQSYFGEQLVEFGFPIDAIIRIEHNNKELLYAGVEKTKTYVFDNLKKIMGDLDDFEKLLLRRAIKTIL